MSSSVEKPASDGHPIVVLVEWQASDMDEAQAVEMARSAREVLARVPGLTDIRMFGDFESGTHCYLLTWRDREAMDRYMTSDAMQAVRGAALPFVAGKPGRRIFVEYGAVPGRAG